MLVLTVKIGEKLYVGDDIELVVINRESRQVKLGIDAPCVVSIVRKELLTGKRSATEQSPS
jgi:carbon storage regulator